MSIHPAFCMRERCFILLSVARSCVSITNVDNHTLLRAIRDYVLYQNRVTTRTGWTGCQETRERGGPHTAYTVPDAADRPPSSLWYNRVHRSLVAR